MIFQVQCPNSKKINLFLSSFFYKKDKSFHGKANKTFFNLNGKNNNLFFNLTNTSISNTKKKDTFVVVVSKKMKIKKSFSKLNRFDINCNLSFTINFSGLGYRVYDLNSSFIKLCIGQSHFLFIYLPQNLTPKKGKTDQSFVVKSNSLFSIKEFKRIIIILIVKKCLLISETDNSITFGSAKLLFNINLKIELIKSI